MADLYNQPINDDVDWGGDSHTSNKPCSGQVVQAYIKEGVIAGKNAQTNRGGYMYFDTSGMLIHLFRDESHKVAWESNPSSNPPLSSVDMTSILTSTVTRVNIVSTMKGGATSLNFSTSDTSMNVSYSMIGQQKGLSDTQWTNSGEPITYTISVDIGSTGAYTQVYTGHASPSGTTPVDITTNLKQWLGTSAGYHLVRISATTSLGWTGSLTYSVYCTSMALSPAMFNWHTPFIQANRTTYTIGGLVISGAINKELHVKVTGVSNNYSYEYTDNIGTRTYPSTSPLQWKPSGGWQQDMFTGSSYGTGIYKFEIWLKSGDVTSARLTYYIMCVEDSDVSTAKLVCVNEAQPTVANYVTNTLFGYSVYYGTSDTSDNGTIVLGWREGSSGSYTTFLTEPFSGVVTKSKQYFTTEVNVNTASLTAMVQAQVTHGNTQTVTYDLDNSASFPCVSDSSFIFELKPTNRNNSQSNKETIVNEATYPQAQTYNANWSGMAWADGVDGWTTDNAGRKCLALPAGTTCNISFQPFANFSNPSSQQNSITVELDYKIANASDSNEPAIKIETLFQPSATPTDPSPAQTFKGLEAYPTRILMHNNGDRKDGATDDRQCLYYEEDTTIHAIITISKGLTWEYGGASGTYNLATIYADGVQNTMFSFNDSTSDYGSGNIVLGSTTADLYIYSIRVYNSGFDYGSAMQNYISSLETTQEKIAANSRENSDVAGGDTNISYQQAYQNYNVMVVEMTNGLLPRADQDNVGLSNFEVHFHDDHSLDFMIEDVETAGQGTTSKNYYLWNLRFRIDKWPDGIDIPSGYKDGDDYNKKRPINTEWNGSGWDNRADGKSVRFGNEGHPNVIRWTAKKNFASSMQSHKIGATRAFDLLHNAVVGNNEVQALQAQADAPMSTVAVYQYPFYAFEKDGSGAYTFIGLYTLGPDKGDKPTFGYNYDNVGSSLITLEGVNHNRLMANFLYPWTDTNCFYDSGEEALSARTSGGSEPSWEVSNCKGEKTDKQAFEASVYSILKSDFKGAYDVAYNNNLLIMPVALCPSPYTTISAINQSASTVDAFRKLKDDDGYSYSRYELYDSNYDVWYYNLVSGEYVKNGTNLKSQCGINAITDQVVLDGVTYTFYSMSDEQKLAYFRQQRAYYFRNGNTNTGYAHNAASSYWDINDSLFHYTFLLVIGATDNFAKNTYPYKMLSGKWRWRQDDLDTIFDIDNNGNSRKPYSLEPLDWLEDTKETRGWNGEDSAFWTLIREAYKSEVKAMGKSILTAMATNGSRYTSETTTIGRLMAFFEHHFWQNAQDYFTKRSYNEDSRIGYQVAYPMYLSGWTFGNVNPLTQALGDHFPAEKRWTYYRMIYLMSKFQQGAFEQRGNDGLGLISFRTVNPISITLTPAMDIYPSVLSGDSGVPTSSPVRIKYGEMEGGHQKTFTATGLGGGDTNLYIIAADCYSDIGDLSMKDISNYPLSVSGKRLKTLKLGDDEPIPSSGNKMNGLTLGICPSLETIDCQNLGNLTGDVDMSNCPRIKSAKFNGSAVTSINVRHGSKITLLSIPTTLLSLDLTNLGSLGTLTVPNAGTAGIRKVVLDNCKYNANVMAALFKMWTAATTTLQNIRLVIPTGKTETNVPAGVVNRMLYQMAQNPSTYHGVDASGNNTQGIPVFIGAISIAQGTAIVQSYLARVREVFTSLTINTGGTESAVPFYDDKVLYHAVLPSTGWDTSDDGAISDNEALAVVTIENGIFESDETIHHFNELGQYFTNVTTIEGAAANSTAHGAFRACEGLEEIQLPTSLTTIGNYAFAYCYALKSVRYEGDSSVYNTNAFSLPPSVTSIGVGAFKDCDHILDVESLGSITRLPNLCFADCDRLRSVTLPETLTSSIGVQVFKDCPALKTLIPLSFTPAQADNNTTFDGIAENGTLIVPAGALNLYDAAWMKEGTTGYLAAKGWSLVENYATDGRIYVYYNVTDTSNATRIGGTGMSGTYFSKMELYSNGSWNQITIGNTYTFSTTGTHVIRFTPSTTTSNPLAPNMFQNAPNNVAAKVILPNGFTILGATMAGSCAATELVLPPSFVDIRANNSFASLQKLYIFDLIAYLSFTNVASHPLAGSQTHHIYLNGEEITNLEIPSGVTQIPQYSFKGCSSITSITIPNTVTTVGQYAFYYCSGLSSVYWPDSITSLPTQPYLAYMGSTSIPVVHGIELNLTEQTSNFGSNTFMNNYILTKVKSLGSITALAANMFTNNTRLVEVNLPATITSIGDQAFNNCTSLSTLNYAGTMSQWSSVTKGTNWKRYASLLTVVHCSDGDVTL